MKIKLDENLPDRLVQALANLGHDVDTVINERLSGKNDVAVWAATQESGRFLVTQDLDFSDIRRYEPGTHHGLLLLRLRMPGRAALFDRVLSVFSEEDVVSWDRCLVVASDQKIRVRRPTGR